MTRDGHCSMRHSAAKSTVSILHSMPVCTGQYAHLHTRDYAVETEKTTHTHAHRGVPEWIQNLWNINFLPHDEAFQMVS